MTKRILHVVTNRDHYDDPNEPTGLWLSELAHPWEVFAAQGFDQKIVSPKGGKSPLEPRSLKFPFYDSTTKEFHNDPERMQLLESTLRPDEVDPAEFDAIYFTGGHAVMYDFTDNEELHAITRMMWENNKVVSSVCHGYCGLINTTLSDGSYLVNGRTLTGFSWNEEIVAGVSKKVPYNVEEVVKERGADYHKAALPFLPYAITDGNLVTGQNPTSAKKTAEQIVEVLG